MTEINPCPFCGASARLSCREIRFIGWRGHEKIVDTAYQVICNKCHARGPLKVRYGWTKEEIARRTPSQAQEAIEAWNDRVGGVNDER